MFPCPTDAPVCRVKAAAVGTFQYLPNMPVRTKLDLKGTAPVFVTTTTANWNPLFEDRVMAECAMQQLEETTKRLEVSVVGYVLMPSHLHASLCFQEISLLSSFMKSFKSLAARRIKSMLLDEQRIRFEVRGRFHLWMPRYDDLIVQSEKQFRIKLGYIHDNPVRAGLVSRAEDYPFSSAGDWLCGRKGLIQVDKVFGWT